MAAATGSLLQSALQSAGRGRWTPTSSGSGRPGLVEMAVAAARLVAARMVNADARRHLRR